MPDRSLTAIAMIIAAMLVFQVSDNLVKLLSQDIPLLQLTFIRCFIAAVFIFIIILFKGNVKQLLTPHPKKHLVRSCIFTALNLSYTYTLEAFPISFIAAAFAAAPLIITALSPWVLKERVSAIQWTATIIGFTGVVLILQPDLSQITSQMLVLLFVPIGYALLLLISKQMSAFESGWVLNFYGFAPTALILIPFVGLSWLDIPLQLIAIAAVSAIAAVLAFGLLIYAFYIGRAAIVSPFEYTAVLMALCADMLLWQLQPNTAMIIGVTLILLCAMFQILEASRKTPRHTAHVRLMDTHPDI